MRVFGADDFALCLVLSHNCQSIWERRQSNPNSNSERFKCSVQYVLYELILNSPSTSFSTKILRKYELHIPDIIPRPKRLENKIWETKYREIFNQLLAQVMINSESTRFRSMLPSIVCTYEYIYIYIDIYRKIWSSLRYCFRHLVSSLDDSKSRPNGFSTITLVQPFTEEALLLAHLATSTNMFGGIDK